MGRRPTLFYLYSTHTCTAHFTFYMKELMYILLLVKYNTIHSIFLTRYQSYCSDIFLAVLSLFGVTPNSQSLSLSQLPCNHSSLNLRRLLVIVSSSRPTTTIVKESHTTRTNAIIVVAVNLARLCFCKYHYDHLALIYSIVEVLQPSKRSRALTRRLSNLHRSACMTRRLLLQVDVTYDVISAMSALAYVNIQSPTYVISADFC